MDTNGQPGACNSSAAVVEILAEKGNERQAGSSTNLSTSAKEGNFCLTDTNIIKTTFMWTIDDITGIFGNNFVKAIVSSLFYTRTETDNIEWSLRVYSHGIDDALKNFLSLYLFMENCTKPQHYANFRFGILKKGRREARSVTSKNVCLFQKRGDWGEKFLRRDQLLQKAGALLSNGQLTLFCEMMVIGDVANRPTQTSRLNMPEFRLNRDFSQLIDSKKHHDVILTVEGKELQAHKAILATRSKAFFKLFEDHTGTRVEIGDVKPEVLSEILCFIYTGHPRKLEGVAVDLSVAAIKYELEGLEVICEEFLCRGLTVDNAASFLIYADNYSASNLKTHELNFICLHKVAVVETIGWKIMALTHHHLLDEAFRAFALCSTNY
ncbi:Speckle-type POZ protein B [Orchesella cincta]|uniref:Speckle-type POZ protein B n=1 Tax=Orchesella cincta TaxID=48709 RepID=A0A1D2M4P7_ORCCI|nr:Speckle-type POZ protein B [Orchesella cincta]